MKYLINARSPWGAEGDVLDVDELTETQEFHLKSGTLSLLKEGEDYEPPFHPDQHSIEEVKTYLDSATYEEQQRVLAEESRSKKRKGIIGDEDQD